MNSKTQGWLVFLLCGLGGLVLGLVVRMGLLSSNGQPKALPLDPAMLHPAPPASAEGAARQAVLEAYRTQAKTIGARLVLLKTLDAWVQDNPQECLNAIHALGMTSWLMPEMVSEALDGSPFAEVRMAQNLTDAELQDRLFTMAFQKALDADPAKALDLLSAMPAHLKAKFGLTLGEAWGKRADAARMRQLFRHPQATSGMVFTAIEKWSEKGTTQSLTFLDSLSEADMAEKGLTKRIILSAIGRKGDPQQLLSYMERQPSSPVRNQMMVGALGSLVAAKPARWEELTGSWGSSLAVADIAADAAPKAILTSPADATRLLDKIDGEKEREEATKFTARELLYKGGVKNPQAVLAWLKTVNDPIVVRAAMDELRFQKAVPQ